LGGKELAAVVDYSFYWFVIGYYFPWVRLMLGEFSKISSVITELKKKKYD